MYEPPDRLFQTRAVHTKLDIYGLFFLCYFQWQYLFVSGDLLLEMSRRLVLFLLSFMDVMFKTFVLFPMAIFVLFQEISFWKCLSDCFWYLLWMWCLKLLCYFQWQYLFCFRKCVLEMSKRLFFVSFMDVMFKTFDKLYLNLCHSTDMFLLKLFWSIIMSTEEKELHCKYGLCLVCIFTAPLFTFL